MDFRIASASLDLSFRNGRIVVITRVVVVVVVVVIVVTSIVDEAQVGFGSGFVPVQNGSFTEFTWRKEKEEDVDVKSLPQCTTLFSRFAVVSSLVFVFFRCVLASL